MSEAAKISRHFPSPLRSRTIEGRWEDLVLPGRESPCNCVDPRSETKSWKKLSVYFLCTTRWDENGMLSIYRRVSQIYTLCCSIHHRYPCVSVYPPPLHNNIFGGHHQASMEMHLEAETESTWRCTGRLSSSEFGDTLGGWDGVNSEMHWEAVIEQVWRWTWRQRCSELRDALADGDRASLDIYLEAQTEWTPRCTLKRWTSQFEEALAGSDRARLEESLKVVNLEGGATAADILFIR